MDAKYEDGLGVCVSEDPFSEIGGIVEVDAGNDWFEVVESAAVDVPVVSAELPEPEEL